jgi:hypothetical protein
MRSLAWALIISLGYDTVQMLKIRIARVGYVVRKVGTEACFSPYFTLPCQFSFDQCFSLVRLSSEECTVSHYWTCFYSDQV